MKLKQLSRSLLLLGLGAHVATTALAQQTTPDDKKPVPAPQKIERVEITGSSIKRVTDEGALPLEVITADQIQTRHR